MDQEVFRKVHPREYLRRFLVNDVRPDGRSPAIARRLTITAGSIGTAVGSAMVKLGRTNVVAGISATLIQPPSASPDQGVFEISVELLSIASASSRSGRAEDALVLTEYLRGLLDPYIDVTKLCVESGVLVWHLRLSVYCVDHDGNMEDATLLASVAALQNALLPTVRMVDDVDDGDGETNGASQKMEGVDAVLEESDSILAHVTPECTNPLHLESFPLSVSFTLFEGKALLDPSAEEESVCDSRITFLMRPSGELKGVLKPGGKHLPHHLYHTCLMQATERAPELVAKLKNASRKKTLSS